MYLPSCGNKLREFEVLLLGEEMSVESFNVLKFCTFRCWRWIAYVHGVGALHHFSCMTHMIYCVFCRLCLTPGTNDVCNKLVSLLVIQKGTYYSSYLQESESVNNRHNTTGRCMHFFRLVCCLSKIHKTRPTRLLLKSFLDQNNINVVRSFVATNLSKNCETKVLVIS